MLSLAIHNGKQHEQLDQAARAIPPGRAPGGELSAAMLSQWMEAVLALQRSDAPPAEFYTQPARAMVDLVGLDVGLVLLYGRGKWQVVARVGRDDDGDLVIAGR